MNRGDRREAVFRDDLIVDGSGTGYLKTVCDYVGTGALRRRGVGDQKTTMQTA
jgi:hypothetical protein